jgi:hypothetical protein
MAYSSNGVVTVPVAGVKAGIMTLSGDLTRDKVLYGGDGNVAFSLTMSADKVFDLDKGNARHVDLVWTW